MTEVEELRRLLAQALAERDAAQLQAIRLTKTLSDLRSRSNDSNVTPLARPVGTKSCAYPVKSPEDAA